MESNAEKEAVKELKQELQRVRILLIEETAAPTVDDDTDDDDDDLELQFTESAIHTLRALKELKVKRSDGGLIALKNLGIQHPPQEFLCPISGLLMIHPVATDAGQTYDLASLRRHMKEGNTENPVTGGDLQCTLFTAKSLLKKRILDWCKQTQISIFQEKGQEMTVLELKKELQGVIKDDDDNLGSLDGAVRILYGLRILKLNQEPPKEFLCPISGLLMIDPVVASNGQTFEEEEGQKWVKQGDATDLSHTLLIPNHLIKEMIAKWCKAVHLRPPPRRHPNDEHITDDVFLVTLLHKFPLLSHSRQKEALKAIRLLTARLPSFRALLGDISPLLTPFMINQYKYDAAFYTDAIATILNVSTNDSNKATMVKGDIPLFPFLIDALKDQYHDSIEVRGYAAGALCQLSAVDSNKLEIGNSGAVSPLIELLNLGHPLASREAASALSSLCVRIENKERVLSEGGLLVVMNKLGDRGLLEQMLEILASLSTHPEAVEVMGRWGVMPRLFRIIVETRSKRDEENSVAVICAVACSDRMRLQEVEKVENVLQILYDLSNNGNARAARKAHRLLSRIRGKDLVNVRIS